MRTPIEIKGYWWLPNLKKKKLFGTLKFSQDKGSILELVGVFGKQNDPRIEQPRIILGISQSGTPITLYKSFMTYLTYPLVGLGGGKYRTHMIFEGVHFKSEEKIKFNKLYGSYTDLDAWVDTYGFKIKSHDPRGKFISKVQYNLPKPQFFDINPDLKVGIVFSSAGPARSIVQTEVKISQQAHLVVTSKKGDINFEVLFKKLNIFSALLQTAAQRIPYPVTLTGFSKVNAQMVNGKNIYYTEIKIYYEPIESISDQRDKIPQEFLFTFKDLRAKQIVSWFDSFEKYETVIYLYRSLFYSSRMFIDTKFLNISQALESLHSILFSNENLPHKKFVKQREKVLKAVPGKLVTWVEGALNNANYKRLRLKILELLNNKKNIVGQFIDDFDLFSKRVVSTRNELVHHNKQKDAFRREELPFAIDIQTMVFEIFLLKIIGFSDKKIKELLEFKVKSHLTGWKHLRKKQKIIQTKSP